MRIEISRFKDGRLKVIVHYEEDSNFWKSDLTECPAFPKLKDKIETTLALDLWNRKYHDRFEHLWEVMRNLDIFKSFFLDSDRQHKPKF